MTTTELLTARWIEKSGKSPEATFLKARQAANEVLKQNAGSPEVYAGLAELDRYDAEWRLRTNQPAVVVLEEGLQYTSKALRLNPQMGAALVTRAALLILKARATAEPVLRARLAGQAKEAVERAIKINRNGEPTWMPILVTAGELSSTQASRSR